MAIFLKEHFVLCHWNQKQLWWGELWLRESLYCCKCCWLSITPWSQLEVPRSAHSFDQRSELWLTPHERKEGCRGHILGDSPHLRLQSTQQLDPVSLWGHGSLSLDLLLKSKRLIVVSEKGSSKWMVEEYEQREGPFQCQAVKWVHIRSRREKKKKKSRGNNEIRDGAREKEKARTRELEALTPIVHSEKQEIRKCFMLISMEISVISQKLLLPTLICPYCLAPYSCCRGGLLYHASALVGPSTAPRCGQPSWDYWSSADVSISSRHCHALSQLPPSSHPTLTRSLSLQTSILSARPPTTKPTLMYELSQICQMMASLVRMAPCKLAPSSYTPSCPLILLRNLHLKKHFYFPPPTSSHCRMFHLCYPSAFTLSASSWFCLLLSATSKENQRSRSHRHGI